MFFFVQISTCVSVDDLETVRKVVAKVGRVRDKGLGTVASPQAGWFEVSSSSCSSIDEVRDRLQVLGARVQQVLLISRGEGKLQVKQLPLFGET